jgi:hypothetical protein
MKATLFTSSLLLFACGGSSGPDNNPDASMTHGDGSTSKMDAPVAQALACKDLAYCSTYEINQYNGTVDTPAGGTVADGIYRLAYLVNPASAGQGNDTFGDYAEVWRFQAGTFVNSDIWGRGTFTTSGTSMMQSEVASCNLGAEGSSSTSTRTYTYTALPDRIEFFDQVSGGGMTWTAMRVFLKVDNMCTTVNTVPTTPGDSYRCAVQNCACNESTQGTVPQCS